MQQSVTLSIPDHLVVLATTEASRVGKTPEQVMEGWLGRAGNDAFESMSDAEVLAVCDMTMSESEHAELTDLLHSNREGRLNDVARSRLEELLDVYQQGTLRKARAWKVAVDRGLRSMNQDAS